MPTLRQFYPAIRLVVCCLVLAIGLRTWLMMGLIEPVTVAGSSMVPALHGAAVTAVCPQCEHQFLVGTEFAAVTPNVPCPQCDLLRVPLNGLRSQRSDRLWVDRTSLFWQAPQRWDIVVARDPTAATEMCVKRIVGLPGEQIGLRDGNVLVNNEVVPKRLEERRALRQRVHREQLGSQRWQPDDARRWQLEDNVWKHSDSPDESTTWLQYQHPRALGITDDVTYNAGLTRKLNLINEFMLSTEMHAQGEGSISFDLDDGSASAQIVLRLPQGSVSLLESKQRGPTYQLSAPSRARLTGGSVLVELSNFDFELLLVIDGRVELRRRWPRLKAVGTTRPFSIGVRGLQLRLRELTVYRDIFHSSRAIGAVSPPGTRWQLAPGEYFLLGDNGPVSIDSRVWGPVSARLLLGKPLFSGR
ncbi:MAG: signal peptidase I [Bythopirellula sp.]